MRLLDQELDTGLDPERRRQLMTFLAERQGATPPPPPEDAPPPPPPEPTDGDLEVNWGKAATPALDPKGLMLQKLAQAQQKDSLARAIQNNFRAGRAYVGATTGQRIEPPAAPQNVAGVMQEHGLGASMDEEARKAQMFPVALGKAQADASTAGSKAIEEKAREPFAGPRAQAEVDEKKALAAQHGALARKTTADVDEAERLRNEAWDGQSLTSRIAAQVASQAGLEIPPGTPYASFAKVLPEAAKQHIAEARAQMQAELANARLSMAGERLGMMGDRLDLQKLKNENDLAQKFQDAMDEYKTKGGLKDSRAIINRIQRLQNSVSKFPNPDQRQIRELAIQLNSILSGSNQSAQSTVEHLVPRSIWGDLKKLEERITNEPTGLDQQKFVNRILETVANEEGTVGKQIRDAQVKRIPGYGLPLKALNPGRYESILRATGIDPAEIDASGLPVAGVGSEGSTLSPKVEQPAERKTIKGKTYEKRNGKWFEVQ